MIARVLVLPLLALGAAAQEWPQFRGPHARGIGTGATPPLQWNVERGENVAWRTRIDGLAHSSPVVCGERVFVTTAVRKAGEAELSSLYGSPGYGAGESEPDEREHSFEVLCLDARSGEVLWRRVAHEGVPKVKRHPKSSHASPTPACDGERVVASFGSEGLYCYDSDGELLWQRDLGVLNSGAPGYPDKSGFQWGFASSPVIVEDRVFVQCDHEGESFVAALDLATGEDVWRMPREEDSTWCTPTVHGEQVILNGYKHIGAYDFATGKEIWKLSGGGDVPVPTPVIAHGLVFLTSAHGRERPLRAVRIEAEGTVGKEAGEKSALAWNLPRAGVYMQTPLVLGDLLYCCSDGGIVGCYEARTGKEIYRERLGAGTSGFSASPVAVGERIWFAAESGEVFVVKAGREFEVLATNELGETCMATPAIAGGTMFFRGRHHLVAVRDKD